MSDPTRSIRDMPLATPFAATEYDVAHMDLTPEQRERSSTTRPGT